MKLLSYFLLFIGPWLGAQTATETAQPKIRFATQATIAPPKFVVFASEWVEPSYRRFIERRIREEFGFEGSPVEVSIKVREREERKPR